MSSTQKTWELTDIASNHIDNLLILARHHHEDLLSLTTRHTKSEIEAAIGLAIINQARDYFKSRSVDHLVISRTSPEYLVYALENSWLERGQMRFIEGQTPKKLINKYKREHLLSELYERLFNPTDWDLSDTDDCCDCGN